MGTTGEPRRAEANYRPALRPDRPSLFTPGTQPACLHSDYRTAVLAELPLVTRNLEVPGHLVDRQLTGIRPALETRNGMSAQRRAELGPAGGGWSAGRSTAVGTLPAGW